ncbi:hypothetical protein AVEN_65733-1, partial [Araneus ventricosus]
GRGGLMVRSQFRDQRVRYTKPDSTNQRSEASGPRARYICYRGVKPDVAWKFGDRGTGASVVLVI